MKLTNEQINALSDDQINEMMTACVLNMIDYDVSQSGKSLYSAEGRELYTISVKDYCNDPAVMMPLAEQFGISIVFDGLDTITAVMGEVHISGGECAFGGKIYYQEPKNKYCRAAAIVYLKIKGAL